MTIATATKLETHPPLARDAAGNLLRVPPETAAFGLARETAGRPRWLKGPDKQLMRFPLHTCPEDIVDLCGPGVYRVYALDALGEQLGDEHISKWDLTPSSREQRNASMDPMLALRGDRPTLMAPTVTPPTDLRFALETMAQMMRTNSDALRLVAESQVDLAKTIATVKGLPRNAQLPPPTVLASVPNDLGEEEDDEDDGEDEPLVAAPTNIYDVLLPFTEKAAELAPMLMSTLSAQPAAAKTKDTPVRSRLTIADCLDWRRVEPKHTVDEQPSAQELSPEELDRTLASKAMAVMKLLTAAERARMMKLFPRLKQDAEVMQHVKSLLAMTDEDACAWIQANLPQLEARFE